MVRRFATRKFGAETAERLTRILEDMADADRIDEVVDAIIDCDSGAELLPACVRSTASFIISA